MGTPGVTSKAGSQRWANDAHSLTVSIFLNANYRRKSFKALINWLIATQEANQLKLGPSRDVCNGNELESE